MIGQQTSPVKALARIRLAIDVTKGTLQLVQVDLERAIMAGDSAEVRTCRREVEQVDAELDRLEAEERDAIADAQDDGRDQPDHWHGTSWSF